MINGLMTPDEVVQMLDDEEWKALPTEERSRLLETSLNDASQVLMSQPDWSPEVYRDFGRFAQGARAEVAGNKTFMEKTGEVLGTIGGVLKDSVATIATTAGDMGVLNPDASFKIPLENVAAAAFTNVQKLKNSAQETLPKTLGATPEKLAQAGLTGPLATVPGFGVANAFINLSEGGAPEVEAGLQGLKNQIDEGNFPFEKSAFDQWLGTEQEQLSKAQAGWYAKARGADATEDVDVNEAVTNSLTSKENLPLLAAYMRTRNEAAWTQLRRNLSTTPERRRLIEQERDVTERSKYGAWLDDTFGDGASQYISEAGDPFELAGNLIPFIKGAAAVKRGASVMSRVGEVLKGVGAEVLSEQGSLFMDNPHATNAERLQVAKDTAIGSLGLMGAGAATQMVRNQFRPSSPSSTLPEKPAAVTPSESVELSPTDRGILDQANARQVERDRELRPTFEVVDDTVNPPGEVRLSRGQRRSPLTAAEKGERLAAVQQADEAWQNENFRPISQVHSYLYAQPDGSQAAVARRREELRQTQPEALAVYHEFQRRLTNRARLELAYETQVDREAGIERPIPEFITRIAAALDGQGDTRIDGRQFPLKKEAAKNIWNAWQDIAADPETFQYGFSEATDADALAQEMSNGQVRASLDEDGLRFKSANGELLIENPNGQRPTIYSSEAGSKGKAQGGGSLLYQIAESWAHNNGKTIGKSHTLSDINAYVRKTSNQLSSALRHGTTKHLTPDQQQGVKGWKRSDDTGNITRLLWREQNQVMQAFPELKDVRIDFATGEFYILNHDETAPTRGSGSLRSGQPDSRQYSASQTPDRRGKAPADMGEAARDSAGGEPFSQRRKITEADIERIVRDQDARGYGNDKGVGRTTAIRAIITRTAAIEGIPTGAGRGVLKTPKKIVYSRAKAGSPQARKPLIYTPTAKVASTGVNAQQVNDAMRLLKQSPAGMALVETVKVVPNRESLNASDYPAYVWEALATAEGFYDPRNGQAVLLTDNVRVFEGQTPTASVARVLLHERVGHDGLQTLREGDEVFRQQWEALIQRIPQEEIAAIEELYPELAGDLDSLAEEWFATKVGELEAGALPTGVVRLVWGAIKGAVERLFKKAGFSEKNISDTMLDDQVRLMAQKIKESLNAGQAPPQGPVPQRPENPVNRERSFGARVSQDERLETETRERFPQNYEVLPNEITLAEANEWISRVGLPAASQMVMDMGVPMSDAVRVTAGMQVMLRLDKLAKNLRVQGEDGQMNEALNRAYQVGSFIDELGTKAGQTVQVFSMWTRMTPEGALVQFEKRLRERNDGKVPPIEGETLDRINDLRDRINGNPRPNQADGQMQAVEQALDEDLSEMAEEIDEAERKAKEALKVDEMAGRMIDRLAEQFSDTPPAERSRKMHALRKLAQDHVREPVSDFVEQAEAMGVSSGKALQLEGLLNEQRKRAVAIAREKALAALVKRLKPKAEKIKGANVPRIVKALQNGLETSGLHRPEFQSAFAEAFGLPSLPAEMWSDAARNIRATMAAPEGSFLRQDLMRQLMAELARIEGVKPLQLMTAYWYANLLSGPNTHAINLFGNGMHLLLRGISMGIVDPQGFTHFLKGIKEGAQRGALEGKAVLLNGEQTVKEDNKYATPAVLELLYTENPQTFRQKVGNVASLLKYVFRALGAEDAFFYHSSRSARVHAAAARVARNRAKVEVRDFAELLAEELGSDKQLWLDAMEQAAQEIRAVKGGSVKVSDQKRRAFEIVDLKRRKEVREEAERFAELATFTNVPQGAMGIFAQAMNHLVRGVSRETRWGRFEPLRPVIPFVNIVGNVANATLDFTPWGFVRGAVGGHVFGGEKGKFTEIESRERMGSAIVGMLVTGVAASLASAFADDEDPPFMIYGLGPSSKEQRQQLMATGWQPYTIKIGDQYIRYNETSLGVMLGVVGSVMDQYRYNREKWDQATMANRAAYTMMLGARGFLQSGFLTSAGDFMDMLSGDGSGIDKISKSARNFVIRSGTGFIPAQGLLRDIARVTDPGQIEDNTIQAAFLKDVPFLKKLGTRPALNVFGEPILLSDAQRIPAISRFGSTKQDDAEFNWLAEQRLWMPGQTLTTVNLPKSAKRDTRALEASRERRAADYGKAYEEVFTEAETYDYVKRSGQKSREAVKMVRKQFETGQIEKKDLQDRLSSAIQAARLATKREMVIEGL